MPSKSRSSLPTRRCSKNRIDDAALIVGDGVAVVAAGRRGSILWQIDGDAADAKRLAAIRLDPHGGLADGRRHASNHDSNKPGESHLQ